jgi:hypothetical protein
MLGKLLRRILGPDKDGVQGKRENHIVHILYPPNIAKIIESRIRNLYLFVTDRNPKFSIFQIEENALDP